MDIIENNLVTAIREIVRQEMNNSTSESFTSRVEDIIAQKGYSIIEDDIYDGIGEYIRNNVTIEINC